MCQMKTREELKRTVELRGFQVVLQAALADVNSHFMQVSNGDIESSTCKTTKPKVSIKGISSHPKSQMTRLVRERVVRVKIIGLRYGQVLRSGKGGKDSQQES